MIRKLFNNPHVVYQTADNEDELPELPISMCTDNSGLILLFQEDNEIIINRTTIKELSQLLKKIKSGDIIPIRERKNN
jgi:hypothetical protein